MLPVDRCEYRYITAHFDCIRGSHFGQLAIVCVASQDWSAICWCFSASGVDLNYAPSHVFLRHPVDEGFCIRQCRKSAENSSLGSNNPFAGAFVLAADARDLSPGRIRVHCAVRVDAYRRNNHLHVVGMSVAVPSCRWRLVLISSAFDLASENSDPAPVQIGSVDLSIREARRQ